MKKIKELQERNKLQEGRDFGIGFTILKKINKRFETYLPFTACRDYLNDFAYVESTKKEIGSIHGYRHELLNCFDNKKKVYFGVNTLHRNKNGGNYNKFDECQKILINNYKNLEKFLNYIEININVKIKTKIELDEETLIIKCSKFWVQSTPLISVYTLLIRLYFNIEKDQTDTILNLLKNNKPFIDSDSMMKHPCVDFFKIYLDNKNMFQNPNYESMKVIGKSTIHNFGIDSFIKKLKK
jgi:hypothetical protein